MWKADHFVVGAKPEDKIATALVNDQGVRITWTGGREGINRFEYDNGDVTFKFSASRYGISDGLLKDYISVELGMALYNMVRSGKVVTVTEAAIEHIKANMENAFLAWPPFPSEKEVPLQRVIFNMADPSSLGQREGFH